MSRCLFAFLLLLVAVGCYGKVDIDSVCPPLTPACAQEDYDGDGVPNGQDDFPFDPACAHFASESCTACAVACAEGAPANAHVACVKGACSFECKDGWMDVNGAPGDGCECQTTDPNTDVENCGTCGSKCSSIYKNAPKVWCADGVCHWDQVCPAGWAQDGNKGCRCLSPVAAGSSECDDGLFCTVGDHPEGGCCVSTGAKDCSGDITDVQCQTAACVESQGACVVSIVNEGNACEGESPGSVCRSGRCTDKPCDCQVESTCCAGCWGINEGGPCDTNLFCFAKRVCSAGACVASEAKDCSSAITEPQCQSATCDASTGQCGTSNLPDEVTACDDGKTQTWGDRCVNGACVGKACECIGQTMCCDGCHAISANEGVACDDLASSTFDDKCVKGWCKGTPCLCSGVSTCCDGCFAKNEGLGCDDSNPLTYPDACVGGKCVGSPCPCTQKNPCCDGCMAVAPGNQCDDGMACTTDSCNPKVGCAHQLQPDKCLIGGACYGTGDKSTASVCEECNPSKGPTAWSVIANGVSCDVGKRCFQAQCCKPSCANKSCGDDGCGGTCGVCANGTHCLSGKCTSGDCPTGFVLVNAGEFDMGAPWSETGAFDTNERPVHHVILSHSYCLESTEATVNQWTSVMGGIPAGKYISCSGGSCAMADVTWYEAIKYCNALSVKDGLQQCYAISNCVQDPYGFSPQCDVAFVGLSCEGYRLPTEAEWEFAARAGTKTATYNGDLQEGYLDCQVPNQTLDPIAWWEGNSYPTPATYPSYCGFPDGAKSSSHAGKLKKANAWGLYDILGNVMEWVWDEQEGYFEGTVTDPVASVGDCRVARGGSYYLTPTYVRAAWRHCYHRAESSPDMGFRPARSRL